jgi:hypothetical protein
VKVVNALPSEYEKSVKVVNALPSEIPKKEKKEVILRQPLLKSLFFLRG